MKVETVANGKIRLFLVPENAMDEAILDEISKQPMELIAINKQVQILDKSFSRGVIIQPKIRETGVTSESLPIEPDSRRVIILDQQTGEQLHPVEDQEDRGMHMDENATK